MVFMKQHLKLADVHNLNNILSQKGKSSKGVNMVLTLLKALFNDAVKWEILRQNPIRNIEPLKSTPRSIKYWMPE